MDVTLHLMIWPLAVFLLLAVAMLWSKDPAEDMACILADCLELIGQPMRADGPVGTESASKNTAAPLC